MSGLLSVLLVTSAALLFIANGQSNYDMLTEVDKKHVDMAIRYANKNSEIQKYNPKEHLNFLQVVGQSKVRFKLLMFVYFMYDSLFIINMINGSFHLSVYRSMLGNLKSTSC